MKNPSSIMSLLAAPFLLAAISVVTVACDGSEQGAAHEVGASDNGGHKDDHDHDHDEKHDDKHDDRDHDKKD